MFCRIHLFGCLVFTIALAIGLSTMVVAEPPVSQAEDTIRDALRGKMPAGGTGDGILDDVLSVIAERHRQAGPNLLEGAGVESSDPGHRKAKRARVAVQLLKASRLLENLGSPEPLQRHADLIARMRAEASSLLLE